MIKTQIGRMGARVALGAAIALAPAAAVAGAASAAPVAAAAPASSFHAADGWYYWHCVAHHEYWRPACQGAGPYGPPPPATGSLGVSLNVGV